MINNEEIEDLIDRIDMGDPVVVFFDYTGKLRCQKVGAKSNGSRMKDCKIVGTYDFSVSWPDLKADIEYTRSL